MSYFRPIVEVGSIVHYGFIHASIGLVRAAAIVTEVRVDSTVTLCVFLPSGIPMGGKVYVAYSDELAEGRWTWPLSVVQKLESELRR
jgi:hypothetical protein